ncbi:MAG TPA: hypothetical protein VII45_10090, partial [Solirubrobacterales bacterium]
LGGAEAMAARSHEWGRLLTGRDASGIYGIQMFGIRREQGRLAELAPAVRILAGGVEREGPWRPGLVAVLAELGMEQNRRMGASTWVAHTTFEYGRFLLGRAAGRATGRGACSARPPPLPRGSAWSDCSERSTRSAFPLPPPASPRARRRS